MKKAKVKKLEKKLEELYKEPEMVRLRDWQPHLWRGVLEAINRKLLSEQSK